MLVQRVEQLNVRQKHIFTAIYGYVDDTFAGRDMRFYNLHQQLYIYLKRQGYDLVVFYDRDECFFSYGQNDLLQLIDAETPQHPKTSVDTQNRVSSDNRPRGNDKLLSKFLKPRTQTTPKEPKNNSDTLHPAITRIDERFQWIDPKDSVIIDKIDRLIKDTKRKCALIFPVPEKTQFEQSRNKLLTSFRRVHDEARFRNNQNRVLLIYGRKNKEELRTHIVNDSDSLFSDTVFRSIFLNQSNNNEFSLNEDRCFFIGLPEKDEIRHWLNRQRLMHPLSIFRSEMPKIEDVVLFFTQKRVSLNDLCDWPQLEKSIETIHTHSAWDELNDLIGLDNVKQEIKDLIDEIRFNQEELQSGMTIRPHMCFMGNPGTGKTTVAKLVAEIFRQEGILSIGHTLNKKVGDLVAEHVGGTRIKTAALCEEARGGVLFIDEAYGLYSASSDGDFVKEAVEVLLQFMEDKTWHEQTIVVLAGYTNEMKELLTKGNPGLIGRFSKTGHLTFHDYKPDELLKIFRLKIQKMGFSAFEHFERKLLKVFQKMYHTRDKKWQNAREVEELFKEILRNYRKRQIGDKLLMEIDIPKKHQDLVEHTDIQNIYESKDYKELQNLTGLKTVKDAINRIIENIEYEQWEMQEGERETKSTISTHLVFLGNPGTGKTTVARLFGKLLFQLGVLNKGDFKEVKRSMLVGQYVGHTEDKTNKVIDDALGGILFIDEAYALTLGGREDFGQRAIEVLLTRMEDERDNLVVIVAGYTYDMAQFLTANPGLSSRFTQKIMFSDYSGEEMWEIFERMSRTNGYEAEETLKPLVIGYLEDIKGKQKSHFGNGREVRKVFERVEGEHKIRMNQLRKIRKIELVEKKTLTKVDGAFLEPPIITHKGTLTPRDIVEETEPKQDIETNESIVHQTLSELVLHKSITENDEEAFVKEICDELEGMAFYVMKAFQGGMSHDLVINYFEDDNFQEGFARLKELKSSYDLDFCIEVYEGCRGFICFFKGINKVSENDISEAINLWNQAINIAESVGIEPLENVALILKRYWEAISDLKTPHANIKEIIKKLETLKADLINLGINPELERMIDMIQAEIFFISGVQALQNLDLEKGQELIFLASAKTEINANKYFSDTPLEQNTFKGISEFYKSIYYFNSAFLKLNNLDYEVEDFIINTKSHTKQSIEWQDKGDLSDVRLQNLRQISLAILSLSDVMFGISEMLKAALKHKSTQKSLEPLKDKIEIARTEIKKIGNEAAEVDVWLRICGILAERLDSLGKSVVQEQQPVTSPLPFSSELNMLIEDRTTTHQPLDLSLDNVKKQVKKLIGGYEIFEALFILEQYFEENKDNDNSNAIIILRSNLSRIDRDSLLKTQKPEDIIAEKNRISIGLLDLIKNL